MNESSRGTKVPGGYEMRFSGYFTLTNALGKPIEVYFATTLHRGSAREPDPVEVAFLSTAVASQKNKNPTVLVEQGGGESQDNFMRFITDRKNSLERPIDETYFQGAELGVAARQAILLGLPAVNMDLELNSKGLPDLLRRLGPLATMQATANTLHSLNLETADAKKIMLELAGSYAPNPELLKVIESEFDSYFQNLRDGFDFKYQEKRRLLSNRSRDLFMAEQIRQSDGPVVVLTHTIHMIGILHHLKQYTDVISIDQVQHSPALYLRQLEREGGLQQFIDQSPPTIYGP